MRSSFYIEDEGEGFDWRSQKERNENADGFELHGRGIMMATHFTENLTYNEKGNAVSFTMQHQKEEGNLIANIYESFEKLEHKEDVSEYKDDNELFLRKIAEGLFEKIKSEDVKTIFTHDRVFRSEMSFLLNNLEDNSLDASSDEDVILLSLEGFTNALLQKPSYALYLSRLLAIKLNG